MFPWEERRVNGGAPTAYWVGVVLKGGLVLLLFLPFLRPDLEQYAGKGMSWRILVFPLAALVVPVLWRLTGSRAPYPYLADNLIVLPPLLDVLWNTLDTYDRIPWWDDVNHLANSAIFAAVIGLWASRYALGSVTIFGLALGLGMTLQVLWEIGEYLTFLARSADVADLYADTIGDLSFDLVGSLVGATFAVLAIRSAGEAAETEPAPALAR
ncbi:MAG TPA: hypothetical protein VFR38_16905 [Gaiellaceae bacterium]|nr:hypothetical protein [Gaiellaceae bacterium]